MHGIGEEPATAHYKKLIAYSTITRVPRSPGCSTVRACKPEPECRSPPTPWIDWFMDARCAAGRRGYENEVISPCPKQRPRSVSAPPKFAAAVRRVPWWEFRMASTSTCMSHRWRGHAIISRKVSQYETQV